MVVGNWQECRVVVQPGRGVDVASMFLLGLGQREMEITWVISIFFWLQTWSERGGSYLGNFHFLLVQRLSRRCGRDGRTCRPWLEMRDEAERWKLPG